MVRKTTFKKSDFNEVEENKDDFKAEFYQSEESEDTESEESQDLEPGEQEDTESEGSQDLEDLEASYYTDTEYKEDLEQTNNQEESQEQNQEETEQTDEQTDNQEEDEQTDDPEEDELKRCNRCKKDNPKNDYIKILSCCGSCRLKQNTTRRARRGQQREPENQENAEENRNTTRKGKQPSREIEVKIITDNELNAQRLYNYLKEKYNIKETYHHILRKIKD